MKVAVAMVEADVMLIKFGEIVVLHVHLHVIINIRDVQNSVYLAVSALKIDHFC